MALQKNIATIYGIDATYWKIAEININWITKTSNTTLVGYVDQEAKIALKQPIAQRSFYWSGDTFPFDITGLSKDGVNAVKVAYEVIKAGDTMTNEQGETIVLGEFTEAVDC